MAKSKVAEGVLRHFSAVIPNRDTQYWYCDVKYTKTEDLLVYFTATGLYLMFGIYEHCLDYQI